MLFNLFSKDDRDFYSLYFFILVSFFLVLDQSQSTHTEQGVPDSPEQLINKSMPYLASASLMHKSRKSFLILCHSISSSSIVNGCSVLIPQRYGNVYKTGHVSIYNIFLFFIFISRDRRGRHGGTVHSKWGWELFKYV